MKKITKKVVCAFTGIPTKVTVEYEISTVRNGTRIVVPQVIKCDYKDLVSQKISGEGFFCNCEHEVKKLIEEKINS